jgi:hypothetical protein
MKDSTAIECKIIRNNNGRKFEYFKSLTSRFDTELTNEEFEIQYLEYIDGERELDRFLIRAMVNLDFSYFKKPFIDKCIDFGTKFITNTENEMLIDISNLDVSRVNNFNQLFYGLKDFNQPLNNWDVSNVEDTAWMFSYTSFKQDLSDWKFPDYNNTFCMFLNLSFDEHNNLYRYTKYKLLNIINLYINSNTDNKEKIKYELMKYMKQYSQHNNEEFINIINELKEQNIKLDINI